MIDALLAVEKIIVTTPPPSRALEQRPGDTIAVWFSCGAASAVAAKRTLELYPNCIVRIINTPIAEEDVDNLRFKADVQKWLGVEIETATNSKWPSNSAVDVWEKRQYMAGVAGAPCTKELKREARWSWEAANHHDWLVLGFTYDEQDRAHDFQKTERNNFLPVLVNEKLTKSDCFKIITDAGLKLPRSYDFFDNANCVGCVKSNSPAYWAMVRREYPDVFQQRSEQSRQIGARLLKVKKTRLFLDELPAHTKPRKVKSLFDCGLFCEQPLPRNKKT